jgi:hypothetical protein
MKVVYAGEKFLKPKFSVFLAGPTPREITVKSWRPDFIETLKAKGFKGSVFAPENRVLGSPYDFDTQVPWEVEGLTKANIVIFWIPRKLDTMPAFTTNIEFGEFMHSGKIAVGFPPDSVNNRYIGKRCEMHNIPFFDNVEDLAKYICDVELKTINVCTKCFGSGEKESNGKFYKCSNCNGNGYINKVKKK